jgi:hypothetical protein
VREREAERVWERERERKRSERERVRERSERDNRVIEKKQRQRE